MNKYLITFSILISLSLSSLASDPVHKDAKTAEACAKKKGHFANNVCWHSEEIYKKKMENKRESEKLVKLYAGTKAARELKRARRSGGGGFDLGGVLEGVGSFIGDMAEEVVSEIGVAELVTNKAKKSQLMQDPKVFLNSEFCEDPLADRDCARLIKQPEHSDLYYDKICSESERLDQKCMKLMLEKEPARFVEEQCSDPLRARNNPGCSPENLLKLKATDTYIEIYCSQPLRAKSDPKCAPDILLTKLEAVDSFVEIHCEDVNRNQRHPACNQYAPEDDDDDDEYSSYGGWDEDEDEDYGWD